ncbi:hypothetical protein TELCIR_17154 [Teladorsagia circumcincta]|uniref:Uncharacterized protein n=1 Tax=Teladorsagia circumcincta TaxID=45464 RepID=A0A2G9TTM3_TELCI|nr:hypothetical protein TELCIR_17154 [Teladorsagia circumcincta]
MTVLDQIIETVAVIVKCVVLTIIACVKALLPMGILPRKSVKGQVVLITGSGSGLGRGMAVEFAKLGAKLVLWDINEEGNLEQSTCSTTSRLSFLPSDVLAELTNYLGCNETMDTFTGRVKKE